jgi:hypothetical protein
MNGQWTGSYEGTSSGTIIVNIDDRGTYYQGVAYLLESDQTLPGSATFFRTPDKNPNHKFRTKDIFALHPGTGDPILWDDNLKKHYPSVAAFSNYVDVDLSQEVFHGRRKLAQRDVALSQIQGRSAFRTCRDEHGLERIQGAHFKFKDVPTALQGAGWSISAENLVSSYWTRRSFQILEGRRSGSSPPSERTDTTCF